MPNSSPAPPILAEATGKLGLNIGFLPNSVVSSFFLPHLHLRRWLLLLSRCRLCAGAGVVGP